MRGALVGLVVMGLALACAPGSKYPLIIVGIGLAFFLLSLAYDHACRERDALKYLLENRREDHP